MRKDDICSINYLLGGTLLESIFASVFLCSIPENTNFMNFLSSGMSVIDALQNEAGVISGDSNVQSHKTATLELLEQAGERLYELKVCISVPRLTPGKETKYWHLWLSNLKKKKSVLFYL